MDKIDFKLSVTPGFSADKQTVFGWASIVETKEGEEVVDAHEHVIDPLELEEAAYMFVRCGGMSSVEHTEYYAGTLIESIVFTKEKAAALGIPAGILPVGWWVGIYIYDEDVFEKVKCGELKMLSVAGKSVAEDYD